MCFGSQRPFSGQRYPYSERQAQYAWCLAVSQRRAVLPFNAVSTVPVGRQAMPGDARKGGTTMNVIASIRNDFQEKFGIPRQSGVVETALSEIIFEPDYRSAEALRGLEGFSHIWLIWAFSASAGKGWSPTVRPPRLGGNARVGRFCLALAVPSKSAGAVGGEAGKYCASVPGRPVVTGFWGRPAARNADFGYKTLPSLRRLYPSGDRRFCGNEAGTPA